jgi:hypothetical protein
VQRQEAAPEEEELQAKPLVQRQETAPEEEELQAKPLVQRQEAAPEEEELQAKPLVQRQETAPEEEELQTKPLVQRQEAAPEEEELQTKPLVQRQEAAPEEEELQTKPLVQRQEAAPEEEELQMKPSPQQSEASHNDASENLENQLNSSKGGGSPLPDDVRSFMEPRFGADFSQVRVHTDTQAVQMNQAVGAQAFTHGSDIYFGAGKSPAVSDLTAHELTHVVQQTGGVQRQIQPMRRSGRGNESNPYSTENVNRPRRGNRAGTRSHDQEGIELQTNPKIKPTVDDEGHALWDGSRDRMRWTENTYQDVLDEKGNPKQRTTGETEYQCAITKEYFLRGGEAKKRNEESIQIDHKTDWRTFVMSQVDPVRFSYKGHLWEAYKLSKVLEAYNNKANLEPICQSKNGSKSGPKHYDGDMITYVGKVPEQTVTSDSE